MVRILSSVQAMLCKPVMHLSSTIPGDVLESLKSRLLSMGVETTDDRDAATHLVVYNKETDAGQEADFFYHERLYVKNIKKEKNRVLVHYWYYPKSFDCWVPIDEPEGGAENSGNAVDVDGSQQPVTGKIEGKQETKSKGGGGGGKKKAGSGGAGGGSASKKKNDKSTPNKKKGGGKGSAGKGGKSSASGGSGKGGSKTASSGANGAKGGKGKGKSKSKAAAAATPPPPPPAPTKAAIKVEGRTLMSQNACRPGGKYVVNCRFIDDMYFWREFGDEDDYVIRVEDLNSGAVDCEDVSVCVCVCVCVCVFFFFF